MLISALILAGTFVGAMGAVSIFTKEKDINHVTNNINNTNNISNCFNTSQWTNTSSNTKTNENTNVKADNSIKTNKRTNDKTNTYTNTNENHMELNDEEIIAELMERYKIDRDLENLLERIRNLKE